MTPTPRDSRRRPTKPDKAADGNVSSAPAGPTTHASTPAPANRPLEPIVRVLASAGTGKTHALSTRLIRLLADGAEIDDIIAATFAR